MKPLNTNDYEVLLFILSTAIRKLAGRVWRGEESACYLHRSFKKPYGIEEIPMG
ncbi:MAG: hypothetical protein ABII90_11020 [Bacteroidota bacterium]